MYKRQQHGLRIFGPTKAAAQLEASKSYAKLVMQKSGVATPFAETFTDFEQAKAYVEEVGAPIVVKADGLAAGKGVVVAHTLEVALKAVEDCLCNHAFGESGAKVLIEEYLDGKEASLMAIVDGATICLLYTSPSPRD